jgi:hypothetical protein
MSSYETSELFELNECFVTIFERLFRDSIAMTPAVMSRANERFKCILANEDDEGETSVLIRSYVNKVRLFSKCISSFVSSRIKILRSVMEIIPRIGVSNFQLTFVDNISSRLRCCADQLDTCTPETMPDIMRMAAVLIHCKLKSVCELPDHGCSDSTLNSDILRIFSLAWTVLIGFEYFDISSFASFVRLVFDPVILQKLHYDVIGEYVDKVLSIASNDKPHLLQYLLFHIVPIFVRNPALSIPFFSEFPKILLFREIKSEHHSIPDINFEISRSIKTFSEHCIEFESNRVSREIFDHSGKSLVSRFMVL